MLQKLKGKSLVLLSGYAQPMRLYIVFMCLFQGAFCALVTQPNNSLAVRENKVTMTCTSDKGYRVHWLTGPEKSTLWNGYTLMGDENTKQTYDTSTPSDGTSILTVKAKKDTTYTCREPGTLADASAQMVVFEKEPTCRYSVVDNRLNLVCTVNYGGSGIPRLIWKVFDGVKEIDHTREATITNENSVYTSELKNMTRRNNDYTCDIHFDWTTFQVTATYAPSYKCDCKKESSDGRQISVCVPLNALQCGCIFMLYWLQRNSRYEVEPQKRKERGSEEQEVEFQDESNSLQ